MFYPCHEIKISVALLLFTILLCTFASCSNFPTVYMCVHYPQSREVNKNNIFPMLVSSCPEGKARGGNEKIIFNRD